MANSWKKFESCVDRKKPFSQKGDVASYQLILANTNLKSKKVDADKVKEEQKITEKIADAFFFIWERNNAKREKVIIVETKGKDFGGAIKQLASCYRMLSSLKIEINGRIVGRSIPALIKNQEYLKLQDLFKGKVKSKSIKMIETFSSFEESTIQ